MKRLAGILGVLAGIGTILWAMRDRLVSIALPREPEPPALGASEPPEAIAPPPMRQAAEVGEEAAPASPSQITDVSGIGPVYATRLEAAGIATLTDLAQRGPEDVSRAADVTAARARGWIESAQDLLGS